TTLTVYLVCLSALSQPTTLIPPPFWHDYGFHRASQFYLTMFLGGDFEFNDAQGLACEKLALEDDTTTSADDHILSLFGVNSGKGQILYNTGMRHLRVFGKSGSGEGEFSHPHGIAVNRAGDIYVADTDNDRVVRLRYTRSGLVYVSTISGLSRPHSVALDSRGQLYVTEIGNSRVVVFDSAGRILNQWSGLLRPTAIAVIDAHSPRNFHAAEFAIVVDQDGERLTKFSLEGSAQASITARAIGLTKSEFAYCALDYYAQVYVTDAYNDQVHKFDRDLQYVVSFGETGSGETQFRSPRGIAIGRQFGQVFIAESQGGKYFWIGLDAYFVGCFPREMRRDQPGTVIALYATEPADLSITIYDRRNRPISSLFSGETRQKAGEILVVWDGRDSKGRDVPPGEYTVKAVLRPTYGGQRRVLRKELVGKVRRV
ncbi:MAG: FlgD immunoglobulin-like domain containing protein, partial [candidate division WOR-3 bacterium]